MLFPDADIYAYEPNPLALSWLEQNAAGTKIRVHEAAVGDRSGIVKLDTRCDSTNSSVRDDGDLPVKCFSPSEIADGRQIDFLKMDCEGSEWTILKAASLLSRTKEFILAYHLHGRSVEELKQLVEASGHLVIECVPTKGEGQYGLLRSVLKQ
jgi:FkbM family methyltransferase